MLKTMLCVSFALAGLTAYAQNEATPSRSSTGTNGSVTMTGTVKSYEAGKSIEIDSRGTAHKFDLSKSDANYTISPDVKVGSEVAVMERNDSGRKSVMIEPADSSTKPASTSPRPTSPSSTSPNSTSPNSPTPHE